MTERMIATTTGAARVVVHRARKPVAGLVLTHGAGGGIDARDLVHLAGILPSEGITVSLVEMPWRVQGKKLAPRPAAIDEAYRSVLAAIRPTVPFVLGGRSAGARSACRIGRDVGAAGVLALAFPLHPPGKPETSRADELTAAGLPTLVIQGERDPFGAPGEFPDGVDLVGVPGADHGLRVPVRRAPPAPLDQADALAVVSQAALEWIVRDVAGNP
jgi:predicted alpha/beta-hydrolase family hydrolase